MIPAAHPGDEQFIRFRQRTLMPLELLEMDSHLAECEACRARLLGQEDSAALWRSLQAEFTQHLSYEQVVAASEGPLSPGAAGHLADCSLCRAEVDELKAFRTRVNTAPRALVVMPARRMRWPVAAIAASVVLLSAALALRHGPDTRQSAAIANATPPPASEPALPPEFNQAVQTALATRQLERAPILSRIVTRRGMLLGTPSAEAFQVTAPVGTAVLTDRPMFRWTAVAGASRYTVAVFDENFRPVMESPSLAVTEWQPEQPLRRDRIYNWQVTATAGSKTVQAPVPPAPEARFQVASEQTEAQLDDARRSHPSNHLLLAVLDARAGALDEAAAELDLLAATDPSAAATLHQSLDAMRTR